MMTWRRPLADLAKLSVLLSSASDGGALSRMMVAHFGKGGASDAGGLFGHGRDRVLRVERHGEASRDHRANAALDPPSHPFANGIGPQNGTVYGTHEALHPCARFLARPLLLGVIAPK